MADGGTIVYAPPRAVAKAGGALDAQRVCDIVLAVALLVFFVPLLVVLLSLTYLQDGGSPLFSQMRIGRGGQRFRCWKIRSMVIDADARLAALLERDPQARLEWARDQKLRKDPRITPFGHFLRQSSLDELPQLVNVMLGEMSLVGPRPHHAEESVDMAGISPPTARCGRA